MIVKQHTTFDDLVTFATMQIIEAITRGTGLRSAVFVILDYAIRWHIENEKAGRESV